MITARYVQPGETVDVGTRLVTVVDLTRVRCVEAEVDEFDIGGMTLGAVVRVSAEGIPGLTWRGTVEEIPDTVVGRHLRPEDTARPVDTRSAPCQNRPARTHATQAWPADRGGDHQGATLIPSSTRAKLPLGIST